MCEALLLPDVAVALSTYKRYYYGLFIQPNGPRSTSLSLPLVSPSPSREKLRRPIPAGFDDARPTAESLPTPPSSTPRHCTPSPPPAGACCHLTGPQEPRRLVLPPVPHRMPPPPHKLAAPPRKPRRRSPRPRDPPPPWEPSTELLCAPPAMGDLRPAGRRGWGAGGPRGSARWRCSGSPRPQPKIPIPTSSSARESRSSALFFPCLLACSVCGSVLSIALPALRSSCNANSACSLVVLQSPPCLVFGRAHANMWLVHYLGKAILILILVGSRGFKA